MCIAWVDRVSMAQSFLLPRADLLNSISGHIHLHFGILTSICWCTWDLIYQELSLVGVQNGIQALTSGTTPPMFVISD
ncbi:hypothetical protein AgCh_031590 [Apium graveolens]